MRYFRCNIFLYILCVLALMPSIIFAGQMLLNQNKEINIDHAGKLKIESNIADIDIEIDQCKDMQVNLVMTVPEYVSKEIAGKLVADLEYEVFCKEKIGVVRVIYNNDYAEKHGLSIYPVIDVKIKLPRSIACSVFSGAGDICVCGVVGEHHIHSDAGNIELNDIQTDMIAIESQSGDITANRLTGCISIHCNSGSINLSNSVVYGTAKSRSGDIVLDLISKHISASTMAGDITLGLSDCLTGKSVISTESGDITCKYPRNLKQDIHASVGVGYITIYNNGEKRMCEGKYNDADNGGELLVLSCATGDITIIKEN